MKNKYFILVFTFLCLIMSQSSYSQDWDWEDMGWNDDINDFISAYEDQGGYIGYYDNAEDYANDVNNDNDYSNDWEYYEYVNPDYVGDTRIDNQGNIWDYQYTVGWRPVDNSDNSNTDIYDGLLDPYNYYNDNDDPFYPYNEDQYPPGDNNNNNDSTTSGSPAAIRIWYLDWDGDRYHSKIVSGTYPGEGWILDTKGLDCDDNDPAITTQCRPNTCKGCAPVINEVAFVDIPDNNTSAYGYVDAQGNVFIKSENGTYKKPSQLNPNSAADRKALNEIAAALARMLEGGNKNIVISITDGKKPAVDNAAFTRTPPGTLIFLNSKGGFSKDLDNYYNFRSILKHEIFHVDDNIYKKKNPDSKYKNVLDSHADVYIKGANDPTYKDTTDDFKKENAGSFGNYLLNMDKSPDAAITRDVIIKKMEQFNKNSTGVKVMFSDYYMQKGGLQLQVEYKGKQEGYIPFEKVDE